MVRFLERIEPVRIPVLAGITPLESLRHAELMANEIPGVSVPVVVLERMRAAEEAGRAREEGLAIARELVTDLAGKVQGLQITVASGAVDSALAVLEAIDA
jgi:methionine synthase / methylenetetrahydrofolate reductase(NADPH)